MAILSSDKSRVTVEKGDTLWDIAEKYLGEGIKYKTLASYNDIVNPDLIYVGQVISLYAYSGSGSSNPNRVEIKHFGLQADGADNTLFATWNWAQSSKTKEYKVQWQYYTTDGYWATASDTSTTDRYTTYQIPIGATQVRVRVKPISKNGGIFGTNATKPYFEATWSNWKTYGGGANGTTINPIEVPGTPSAEIEGVNLTVKLTGIKVNATHIEFKIVKNDKTVLTNLNPKVAIVFPVSGAEGSVSYHCAVSSGGEYKVCCRAVRDKYKSDWSPFSQTVTSAPATPSWTTDPCKALSETSVRLTWKSTNAAKTYDIEYATDKTYFDNTDQTTVITGITKTTRDLIGLESGKEYSFRIRAVGDSADKTSGWTSIVSVVIGEAPDIPTTWSSSDTVIIGETVDLRWMHNSKDGSDQKYAEILAYIEKPTVGPDGITNYDTILYTLNKTIEAPENEDEEAITSYTIDTSEYESLSGFKEGVRIRWKVRTAGCTLDYGEWSVERAINVYSQPTLDFTVTNGSGESIVDGVLESFPIKITALGGPETQVPTGYHVSITALESYETVDNIGFVKMVNAGSEIYAKFFDTNNKVEETISAGDVDFENGYRYKIACIVSMNSGLTVETAVEFTVSWSDVYFEPSVSIGVDENTYSAYLRPSCSDYATVCKEVIYDGYFYTIGLVEYPYLYGEEVEGAVTIEGYQVYTGADYNGNDIYFCRVEESTITSGVLLSVYRRNFDGTFTLIESDIENTGDRYITDPHPALDYARYRIVAMSTDTGTITYYDTPGFPIQCDAVVIQWDEEWVSFDNPDSDPTVEGPWKGSILKLPYNVDISENFSKDTTNIEYIGREHPVAYYGTQLGVTSSWSMVVPKDDKETIHALRRLSRWMGDVYIREPSGTGYWANISVSFSQTHLELTVPVTIDVTRVEGGV